MLPYFSLEFANPSSQHIAGRAALAAVETSREQLALLVGTSPRSLVFTSGATEANNAALRAMVAAGPDGSKRLVVSATEHKSVLEGAMAIQDVEVSVAPVDSSGVINLSALEDLLRAPCVGVSVMLANNETGVLNPIEQVVELAHEFGVPVHSDTTQAIGKVDVDLQRLDVDFASISGHKMYAPKGVGAMYVRHPTRFAPLLQGGGQERGLRAGTLNVPGIVGLGKSAMIVSTTSKTEKARIDRFWARLSAAIDAVEWIAADADRLPNTLNVRLVGANADAVLARLPRLALATGSACTSAVPAPSHVLLAMGLSDEAADECIRVSVGRPTTDEEVDMAVDMIAESVRAVRLLSAPAMSATTGQR